MPRLLPLAAVERLAKKAGAERISEDALRALGDLLEDYAGELAKKSMKYSRYAKRTTIKREDVELSASE